MLNNESNEIAITTLEGAENLLLLSHSHLPPVVTPPSSSSTVVVPQYPQVVKKTTCQTQLFASTTTTTTTTAVNVNKDEAFFVVVSLMRPSLQYSWGLSLTMLSNQLVVIGDCSTPAFMIRYATLSKTQTVTGLKAHEWFGALTNKQTTTCTQRNALAVFLLQRTVSSSSMTVPHQPGGISAIHAPLQPGDVVIGINSRSVADFPSLMDLTQFMRSCTTLNLLIYRYMPAVRVAWQQKQLYVVDRTQGSYHAAKIAGDIVWPILVVTPPLASAHAQAGVTFRSLLPPTTNSVVQSSIMNTYYTAADKKTSSIPKASRQPSEYTNPLFRDEQNNPIPYCDNSWIPIDPDDGQRFKLFLNQFCQENFLEWLQTRKRKWRSLYRVHEIAENWVEEEVVSLRNKKEHDLWQRDESSVPIDFWSRQGFASFHHWLRASTAKWKQDYKWNQRKRRRLERDCREVVQLDGTNFKKWLRVRKNQWRIMRRKRQREREQLHAVTEQNDREEQQIGSSVPSETSSGPSIQVKESAVAEPELLLIDALLEKEEQERLARQARAPLDIVALFDCERGCPDDVVAHCLSFLDPIEHGKLLCINRRTRKYLMARETLWRQLCPTHWKLPRRPRKSWHEIYLGQLRRETESSRKRLDDLLMKASNLLLKGDFLQTIEKLVTDAERNSKFDINYTSGVVCERNSLLNLAVIHRRPKIVRWLVEAKDADIESSDRGNFTPLLNAAWAGDRYLVRYFMQRGADRSKVGTYHYTRPLAPPDFEGLTAEGWAEKKGHKDIARLLRLGL